MTDTVPSAPRRRSLLEGFNGGMQSMGMWYEKVFEKYGEKVYDYSLIILGVFMALYVGLAFGLLVAEEEVDIDELWVEEGTRLRDERDEFNKRWGGISHLEIVAITKNNGGYVSTREGVKAMILALTPMLRVVEAGNNDTPGIQVGITNKDEITLTYTFDGKTRTMQEKNICESPTASSLFGPGIAYPGELATNTAAWAGAPHIVQAMTEWTNLMISSANAADDMFSGVTSVQANSALVNSSCPLRNGLRSLWLKDGLPDATSTVPARQQGTNYLRIDIPDAGYTSSYNFTVDRFPCIRGGPADCFQEGNFDYPYGLKRMEGLGYTMSVLASFGAALLQAPFSYVPSDVTNVTKFVIADAGFAANAAWAPTKGLFSQLVNANVAALGRPDCTGAWANVGPAVANMAFRLVLGASSFKTTVNTTMNALVGVALTQSQADGIIGLYEFSTDGSAFLFWAGTGYAWRKSLQSTTDFPLNTDIDDHIVASSANTDNSSYTSTACITTGKCCPYWSQTRVSSGTFVGTKFTDGGVYDGRIKALRTVINHFSPGHPIWINRMNALFGVNTTAGDRSFDKDSLLKVADAYEQKFIDYLTPIWEQKSSPYKDDFADYKIDFLMWRSATDVVREGGKIESGLIIIGYTILIIYACFSLARTDGCANFMVYSRSLVVVWGVFTVALATLTGFGVTALIGWKLTPISIQLVPFLALGIGVDDMFVIAHTTVYHAHLKDPRERIVKSMSIAGPSVLLTSVTNATAFFLAVFTPIPAVSTFVLQMGMTAILTIIALLTIFVPILVWDSKRVAARNPELCFSCCKPDQVPEEAGDGERKGFINKCTKGWFVPLMKSLPGKIVTLVFFTTLFIVLTYLAFTNNETGLRLSDITLAGTYQRDYAELQENNFPGYNNYMITMGKNQPYQGSVSTCDSKDCKLFVIFELINKMQASPYLAAGFNISDFNWPTSLNSAVTGNDYTNVPANQWNAAFQGWITTSGATSQLDMYCEDGSGNLIQCPQFDAGQGNIVEATKMTIFNDNLIEHERFLDTIRDARDRMDSVDPKDSFIFGWMYQYWEQYLTIEENLYTVMGLSLAGVLGAIIIFQCDLISSLIVTIFILIIDLEVYGAISFMDVKINAFSVVNLVMTVGMAVEFTAHISHVFLLAQGNRNQRMGVALEEMMAPMLSGFLSSFLAVIPLAFAKFPFFRAYYFGMFAAMIILAFGNGMIFMPVVLSLIGPGARAPAGGGFYKPTHSTNVQMSTANEI